MNNFENLGLPASLKAALDAISFVTPTPIQAQTIELALSGKDIIGSAQTGTGKTGAYGIPLVAHLLNNKDDTAIIVTPTRELAVQVLEALKTFLGKNSGVKTALLIGGDNIFGQLHQLRAKPRLIVGTPGRINDHLIRNSLNLTKTKYVVFDETDRMLDLGFSIQLEEIAKYLPKQRQTLMFSATMDKNIEKLAGAYLTNPIRVAVGSTTSATEKVSQEIMRISEGDKYNTLLDKLNEFTGSVIVFVKTKIGTEKLAMRLRENGHSAEYLHGDLRQRNRDRAIKDFRNKKHRILIATDVAARGLDIPHIEYVVNYDLPQCPEDYIHRIGRTARAGREGVALSLITPQDRIKWVDICKLMNIEYTKEDANTANENKNQGKKRKFGNNKKNQRSFGDSFEKSKKNVKFKQDFAKKDAPKRDFAKKEFTKPDFPKKDFFNSEKPFKENRFKKPEFKDSGFSKQERPFKGKPNKNGGKFRKEDKFVPFDKPKRTGGKFSEGQNFGKKPKFGQGNKETKGKLRLNKKPAGHSFAFEDSWEKKNTVKKFPGNKKRAQF